MDLASAVEPGEPALASSSGFLLDNSIGFLILRH